MSEIEDRRERFERGRRVADEVTGGVGGGVVDALADVSPELGHQMMAWGFGEIYSRPQLPPRDRQLVTLGMLTALGGCESQLDAHVRISLNVGLTPEQIVETILHAAPYCGFPRALNAMFTAKRVLDELGLLPVGAEPGADPGAEPMGGDG